MASALQRRLEEKRAVASVEQPSALAKRLEEKRAKLPASSPKSAQPMVMGRFKELEYAPPPQRSLGERISRGAHLVAGGLAKGATLGLVGPGAPIDIDRILARLTGQPAPAPVVPETRAERIAAGAGELGGAIAPISRLYGAGTALTQRLIPKAASLYAPEGALTSAGRAALPGVAAGTVYEGGKAAIEGKPPEEVVQEAIRGGLIWGAGDVALQKGVAPLAKKGLEKVAPLVKKGAEKVKPKPRLPIQEPAVETTPVAEITPKPKTPATAITEATATAEPEAVRTIGTKKELRSFPQTVAKGELTAPELKKMIKENPQLYQPISNRETLAVAQRIIDDNFDAAKALVMEGKSFDNATETAMAQDIVRRLQNDKRWDEAFEVMAKASEKLTRAGQTVQAASMWRRMTPEGMLKYTYRVFEEANKQLPAGKKVKVTNDLQKMIFDRMKIIEQMPDGIEKDQAIALLLDEIEGKIPVSLGRKLSTIQAMAHLLNAKTALRNLLGNTSFAVAETISNALAVPIDKVISKYTGKRMVGIPVFKEPFRVAWERAKRAAKEVGMGINVEPGKYELFRGRTFRGGILGAMEKGLGYTLRVPDEFYKGFREAQALQQMTRMAGVKEPTEEMLKQAAHEARYAAFQDESLPARLLGGIKEVVNNIGIGKKIPGAYVRSTREFGLGDFIIKYTRVPGNLISRAIEYTPAGALKALSLMAEARRTGVLNQREMSLTLARPLTGSLMIGLGAWLHNKGLLLSEDKERDKDAKALERAEGLGNYKINISAIRRLLAGGDAKPKAGDELYSYNWMEPVSVALAIGATVDAQLKKQGTPAQTANAIGANSVAEILDLPTLYIIKSMVYEGMSDDSTGFTIATVPLAEGIPGFIPSVVRQYAQMTDPTARVTRGETPIETAALKTRANIPGVRRELEPRLSPLGEEITYPTGLVTSMVSPATKSVYTPTEFTKQLKQLEDLTGETGHYPRRDVPTTFTYQKKKIELTPTEQTEYQRIAGQRIKERFTRILGNVDVTKLSDSQRMALVRRLESAIAESREAAKRQVLKGRK